MKKAPFIVTLSLWTVALPCMADTFTLKDGTVLEAKVLKEDADSYTLEIQVTKSIKDERIVAKADVQKVDVVKPDLIAFEPISKLLPTQDFLPAEDYAAKISLVNKFLEANRGSSKTKDAKAILDTLKAEAAAVAAGGLKMNGKVVTSSEYQANQYDIDARIQESKIRSLVAGNQTLEALRAFSEFDKDYRTTLSYGALAPLMGQVIKSHVEELKLSLLGLDARVKVREQGLQRMAPADRAGTEAAIKEENAAIEANYQAEKTAKQNWPTITPYHKASMEDSIRFGELEITRLAAVKTVLGVDGGKTYRELYSAVKSGANTTTVTAAFTAAKTALVPSRYIGPLDAAVKGAGKK
ncbi:MAG: PTPDL family protein [Luteolibacter sp.]